MDKASKGEEEEKLRKRRERKRERERKKKKRGERKREKEIWEKRVSCQHANKFNGKIIEKLGSMTVLKSSALCHEMGRYSEYLRKKKNKTKKRRMEISTE